MTLMPQRLLFANVLSAGTTNKMYPSYDQVVSLHKQQAPDQNAFEIVFTHSVIVFEIAVQLMERNSLEIDTELVRTGALLHDIGTYALYKDGGFDRKNYIKHGILGYEILKKEKYPEKLCRIASNHTGTGITKEMIRKKNLPLPEGNYIASTIEERLVMYADKFHSKTPKFNTYDSYLEYSRQFGKSVSEKFIELSKEFGIPDLEVLSKKYHQPII